MEGSSIALLRCWINLFKSVFELCEKKSIELVDVFFDKQRIPDLRVSNLVKRQKTHWRVWVACEELFGDCLCFKLEINLHGTKVFTLNLGELDWVHAGSSLGLSKKDLLKVESRTNYYLEAEIANVINIYLAVYKSVRLLWPNRPHDALSPVLIKWYWRNSHLNVVDVLISFFLLSKETNFVWNFEEALRLFFEVDGEATWLILSVVIRCTAFLNVNILKKHKLAQILEGINMVERDAWHISRNIRINTDQIVEHA